MFSFCPLSYVLTSNNIALSTPYSCQNSFQVGYGSKHDHYCLNHQLCSGMIYHHKLEWRIIFTYLYHQNYFDTLTI